MGWGERTPLLYQKSAEFRHLPQKAVFGLYLEWYSSHPTKMHICSFRTVHEWKSAGCSDGENRLDSRTLADHPQKCVGEGEIQFRGISCRIKPSISGSGYEHRSLLSMRCEWWGYLMVISDRAQEHRHATPENRRFYGQSVSLTEIGVQFVMRTLQGEIGTCESFIWTYWWAIVLSFGGNFGIVGPDQ